VEYVKRFACQEIVFAQRRCLIGEVIGLSDDVSHEFMRLVGHLPLALFLAVHALAL
jgi:hypothetical protein